jgi:hypothetical protein
MKKFYFVAASVCLFICLQSSAVFAQIYNINSVGRTWSNTIGAGTCTGCTITITGNFTFTIDVAATLVNSTVKVTNNSSLAVDANLTLQNSNIIIGDANSTTSTANVNIANNASILLSDAASNVRVGNVNNFITGGAGGGGNTAGEIQAHVTITIFGFTFTTYAPIFTGTGSSTTSPYNLNCGGTHPNACKNGFVYGPVINSQTSVGGGFIVFTAFGTDAPLPVVLGSFTASLIPTNSVQINWTTEQEVNLSYFSIQRSANGSEWQPIGSVAGKGNSATPTAYSYVDKSPFNGIDYYRLKMVDLDGYYAYSPISVVRSNLVQNIIVFPNPAKDYVNITLGGAVPTIGLRLIDLSGKVLQEQRLNASAQNTTVSMPVSHYAQGVYIVQAIKADGTTQNTKITIGIGQ